MRFVGAAGFAVVMLMGFSAPVLAQSSPAVMNERIETLERQLRLLQRRLSGGQVAAAVADPADSGSPSVSDRRLLADISAKLGTLERQIRQLNGRMEEFEYQQNELSSRVEQLAVMQAEQNARQYSADDAGALPSAPEGDSTPPTIDSAGGETLSTLPVQEPEATPSIELPEGSAAERYGYAFGFVRSNDLDSGRTAMEQFLEVHGDDPQAANAKFWLGRIHMQQGRNAEAAQMFLRLIEEHPNHNRRGDSLVDLADVLINLDAAEDACNALAEFRRIENEASDRLRANARRLSDRARCNLF